MYFINGMSLGFEVKFYKFIVDNKKELLSYISDIKKFNFRRNNIDDKEFYKYTLSIIDYLNNKRVYNKDTRTFIESYGDVFKELANIKGDNFIGDYISLLSTTHINNFIHLVNNDDRMDGIINKLYKMGLENIYYTYTFSPNNYGISNDENETNVDYIDKYTVNLNKDDKYILNADPEKAKFVLQLSLIDDGDKKTIKYNDFITTVDYGFDAKDLPDTVEEIEEYIDTVRKKKEIVDKEDKVTELSEALNDYKEGFEHLMKVSASHKVFFQESDKYDHNSDLVSVIKNKIDEEKEELTKLQEEYFPDKKR